MKTQEQKQDVYQVASALMDGVIYDAEDVTAGDANLLTDILDRQGYALRVYPEFSLIAAIPCGSTH